MKTASYFTYTGPGRVGISRFAPHRCPAGYRIHKALAPYPEMLKMGYRDYCQIFNHEILANLNPQEQWDLVHEKANGAEPVMLCFERPPFQLGNWCHRRLVAEWFEANLGHVVEEIGHGNVHHLGMCAPDNPRADLPHRICFRRDVER